MLDKVQDEVTNGEGEITECIGQQNTCNLMFREIASVIHSLRGITDCILLVNSLYAYLLQSLVLHNSRVFQKR